MSARFLKLLQRSQQRRSLTPEQARFLNANGVTAWLKDAAQQPKGTRFQELALLSGAALYAATAEIDPVEAPRHHAEAERTAIALVEKLGREGVLGLSEDRARQALLETVDAFDGLLSEIDPGVYPNIARIGRDIVVAGDVALTKDFVDYAHGGLAGAARTDVIEHPPQRKLPGARPL